MQNLRFLSGRTLLTPPPVLLENSPYVLHGERGREEVFLKLPNECVSVRAQYIGLVKCAKGSG